MYQKKQKTWHKHFDFAILDLLCMECSFLIAFVLRFCFSKTDILSEMSMNFESYQRIMFLIAGLHFGFYLWFSPYSRVLRRSTVEELKCVLSYNLYMLAGIIFVLFVGKISIKYSRAIIIMFVVIDYGIMMGYRYLYKKHLCKKINHEKNQSCMLVVAPYSQINGILHNFYKDKVSTIKIVGIILTDAPEMVGNKIRNIPIVGTLENMYEYARTNVLDEALICLPEKEVSNVADIFINMGITVHISIQNLVQIPRATVNQVNGISVITASVNMVTARQLMIKRLVDIFFGLCGSIVTVLITLIIGPMIYIADPGPIFFCQERVGKNGRTFKIWKFRTMYKDAEARKAELMAQNKMSGLMFKMDNDPRTIRYGKKFSLGEFMRKTSIDELPQSFNILAGSMSVVGTRPPTVKEYEQYELHHKGRLATKPGLTGMWQVSGRSDITDFEEVVRLDKEYIDNFSLELDLKIILKTVKVVIGKKGSV